MRLISNQELDCIAGGMEANVDWWSDYCGYTDWASSWGFEYSDAGFGESSGGSGTVQTNSSKLADALELMKEIKSTATVDVEVSCKLHADNTGAWSVDCTFKFTGGAGGRKK